MVGIVSALVLLLSAISLPAAAVIHNQIEPNIGTALTVPFANLAGLFIALMGMAIAIVVYRKNPERTLAKWTMVAGIVSAALLMLLLPLSNLGYLSSVH